MQKMNQINIYRWGWDGCCRKKNHLNVNHGGIVYYLLREMHFYHDNGNGRQSKLFEWIWGGVDNKLAFYKGRL